MSFLKSSICLTLKTATGEPRLMSYESLSDAAAWPVASALRHFRDEFEYHIKHPDKAKATFFPSKSIYWGAKSTVAV